VNLKEAFTEMYPWISWEPFADPLESAGHNLGTAVFEKNGTQKPSK